MRRNEKRWCWASIAIVCIFLASYAISTIWTDPTEYSGTVIFETKAEYANFKRSLVSDNIHIRGLTEVSSESPIMINFRVRIPHGETFPYGNEVDNSCLLLFPAGLFLFLGLLSAVMAFRSKARS